jgi:hypothetical protein
MPDQHGFGNDTAETTRLCQLNQSGDRMNQEDDELAHSGHDIKASKHPIEHIFCNSPWTPFQSSGWLVPSVVQLDPRGRYIFWEANLLCTSPREPGMVLDLPRFPECTSSGGKGMLEQFLALEEAPVEQIAKFVARWGPLQIRRVRFKKDYRKSWVGWNARFGNSRTDELARKHVGGPPWSYVDDQRTAIKGEDPVYAWRYWARKFRHAIRAWDLIQNGKASLRYEEWRTNWVALTEDPESIKGWEHFLGSDATAYDNWDCGNRLSWILKQWMYLAGISLKVQFSDPQAFFTGYSDDRLFHEFTASRVMHFEICTNNVFGGLVLQLVAAISGVSGFAICSLCGRVYTPTRQPRAGMMHYCQVCIPRAAVIKAQRYRARKRNTKKQKLERAKGRQQRDKTRKR